MTTTMQFYEDFNSSNIKGIAYSGTSNTLWVKFTKGTIYSYSGVTKQRFDAFKNAESKGKYFHKNIRGNYEYEKVQDDDHKIIHLPYD